MLRLQLHLIHPTTGGGLQASRPWWRKLHLRLLQPTAKRPTQSTTLHSVTCCCAAASCCPDTHARARRHPCARRSHVVPGLRVADHKPPHSFSFSFSCFATFHPSIQAKAIWGLACAVLPSFPPAESTHRKRLPLHCRHSPPKIQSDSSGSPGTGMVAQVRR